MEGCGWLEEKKKRRRLNKFKVLAETNKPRNFRELPVYSRDTRKPQITPNSQTCPLLSKHFDSCCAFTKHLIELIHFKRSRNQTWTLLLLCSLHRQIICRFVAGGRKDREAAVTDSGNAPDIKTSVPLSVCVCECVCVCVCVCVHSSLSR